MNVAPEQPSDREELARHAARAMLQDPMLDPRDALQRALKGVFRAFEGTPPGPNRIYRHLRAMLEEVHGEAGFRAGCRRRTEAIVEVLDLVEYLAAPDGIEIAGRAARGFLEGPLLVFARVHGGRSLCELAPELEANGIREVGCATAHTRLGPLPSIHFESDGIRFNLVECPRLVPAERNRNLYSGEPIVVASLTDLHALLAEGLSPDHP